MLEHLQDSFGHLNPGTRISYLPCSLDSGAKAFVVDGFKKVVQSVDLERPQSMLLVGGKKDDGGQMLPRQSPENLKAVHAGHLHIEENNIRRELKNLPDRRRAVSALTNDFDVFELLQPEPDSASCQRLIHPQLLRARCFLCVLRNSSERQLDDYLTTTGLRPLQGEVVIIAVQRLQTFYGISQANSIPIFVLCFTISRSRIPDNNLQSVNAKSTRDPNPSPFNQWHDAMADGILHQRLQQHAGHERIQGVERNYQIDLQALSQPGLLDSEIALRKSHLLRKCYLRRHFVVQAGA